MTLVSIIIPIYNVEKYLENCVNSVINQSYSNLEIILVDDGSPDNCPKMCDDFSIIDKRIKVIHKKNAGLGLARNSGLEIATGEYVIFVDSDDWIDLDTVEKMLSIAQKDNCDFIVAGFNRQYDENKIISSNKCTDVIEIIKKSDIQEKILYPILGSLSKNSNDVEREMCVWTNMYKLSIIRDSNIIFANEREFLSEDLLFNINYIMKINSAALVPYCFYHYRLNHVSLTNAYRKNRFSLLCNLYKHEKDLLSKYNIWSDAQERVYRTFIMKARNAIRILVNSKNLSFSKKYTHLKKILNNEILIEILSKYPINSYKMSLKVVAKLMKNKLVLLLMLEQKLRYFLKSIRG